MITIKDGRSELYQWDTGRILDVPEECSQIHFSNRIFGRSVDVDVLNGEAKIPDFLLQSNNDLNVWGFVGADDDAYTKISKTFKVNKRNKPSDYVFTATEQKTIDELIERAEGAIENAEDLAAAAADSAKAANESALSSAESAALAHRDADDAHGFAIYADKRAGDAKAAKDGAEAAFAGAKQSEQHSSDILNRNKEVAVRTPYVGDTGNWFVWSGETNTYVDSGTQAQGIQGEVGNVMYATFYIDPNTGELTMNTPADYAGPGFEINSKGELEVIVYA